MTDERVEPTKEWLDALIDGLEPMITAPGEYSPEWISGFRIGEQALADAILASQPERVECAQPKFHEFVARHKGKLGPIAECPYCGGDAQ